MSDNNIIAEAPGQAVNISEKSDSKIEDAKSALPVDIEKNEAVGPAVVDDGKAVESAVADDGKAVESAVADDGKAVEPAIVDDGKAGEPAIVGDGKAAEPAIVDDGKAVERAIVGDGKAVEPAVVDDGKAVESGVTVGTKTVELTVVDETKNMKPVVVTDAKTVELLPAKETEAVKSPAEDSSKTVEALVCEVAITSDAKDGRSTQIEMKSLLPESDLQMKTDDEKAKKLKLSEDKSILMEKPSGASLAVETLDAISVLSLHGSSESEITPPPTCFNWFKKYSSPQRLMSKLMHKREYKIPKSQKSDLPSLDSAVSDPKDSPPEILLEGGAKYYENIFIGAAIFIPPQNEIERIDYATLAEEKIIPAYLGAHPCYDVMPTSGKVIILSVELLVKNAFSALVSNDIKAAPLWDAGYFDFVGMLTISDFINVLRHYYYSSPEDIKDIENQSISTWRRITKVEKPFVKVNGSDSLVQATKLLIQEGVHRIPVFDEKRQSVLFVLTRKRLLHFLSNSLFENFEKTNVKTPSFFRKTIRELKIGTFEDIATVEVSTKVIDALDLFVKRGVSSLPVVEKDNILIDIFEKFDVFQLAKEQTYHNLDMPIKEAISKADVRETAWICTLDETFGTVINRFVNNKVHRIVVINENRAVVGIISLSDVLKFLVLNPLENSILPSTAETIEEDSEGAVGGTSPEPSTSLGTTAKADSIDEESNVSEAVENLKIEDSKAE